MTTTIYHNPRCSKSRQTLQLLEDRGENISVVKYLEDIPSEKEVSEIIKKLGISPIQLVRKNETIWKEVFKGRDLSDSEIIKAMVQYPKLMERPVVLKDGKAALGRPPEAVTRIL